MEKKQCRHELNCGLPS